MIDMTDESDKEDNSQLYRYKPHQVTSAPHYYAFYLGSALILCINMEVYVQHYNETLDPSLKEEQEKWLVDRLKAANSVLARIQYPWIVVVGHQPLYCHSSGEDESCKKEADLVKINFNTLSFFIIFICIF